MIAGRISTVGPAASVSEVVEVDEIVKAADPPQAPDGRYVEVNGKVTATLEDGSTITGQVKSVSGDTVKVVVGGKNFTATVDQITVVEGPDGTEPKTQLPLKPSDLSTEQRSQVKLLSKIWPDEEPQLEGTPDSVTVKWSNGTAFTIMGDGTVTVGAPDVAVDASPPDAAVAAPDVALPSEDPSSYTDEELLTEIQAMEEQGLTDDPFYDELLAEKTSRGL